MTAVQTFVLIVGAAMIVVGLALFARKGTRGKNTIRMFGMEFQLAGSSLVIVVLGGVMVLQGAGMLSRGEPPPDDPSPGRKTIGPEPPPPRAASTFTAHFPFPPEEIETKFFEAEAIVGVPASDRDWFTVAAFEFGATAHARQAFRVTYEFTNTTDRPITLDAAPRYFTFTDNRGRSAPQVEFDAPPAQSTVGPRQKRTIAVVFDTTGWHGKDDGAKTVYAEVNGFHPIRRASWAVRSPVAARL